MKILEGLLNALTIVYFLYWVFVPIFTAFFYHANKNFITKLLFENFFKDARLIGKIFLAVLLLFTIIPDIVGILGSYVVIAIYGFIMFSMKKDLRLIEAFETAQCNLQQLK